MLVSIKSREYFAPGKSTEVLATMRTKAKEANMKKALCLLVIFGAAPTTSRVEELLQPSDVEMLWSEDPERAVVCKVLWIPANDSFGISRAFQEVVSMYEKSEILSSHSFLRLYSGVGNPDHFVDSCLRKGPRSEDKVQDECRNMTLGLVAPAGTDMTYDEDNQHREAQTSGGKRRSERNTGSRKRYKEG
jgi:hypothetical protein